MKEKFSMKKYTSRVAAVLLAILMVVSAAVPPFALGFLMPGEEDGPTVTSVSEPKVVDENGTKKVVKTTTYSDGTTKDDVDTGFTGIKTSGNSGYYFKDGVESKSTNGKIKYNRGTYTIKNGKVTGVKFSVPKVNQMPRYLTGCEAAASASLLQFYGYNVTVDDMVNYIPREDVVTRNGKRYGPSIYEKFAGNPRGGYTSKHPGYGAFAPVVTKAMNHAIQDRDGKYKAVDITGSSTSDLYRELMKGHPCFVWATYNMETPDKVNSWYVKDSNGNYKYFSYPRGTHTMILYGFDANNVYVMDPYGGEYKPFPRSSFASKYKLLKKMAIEIQKA